MKFSLIVKPKAELDILKSAKWYEERQENLGLRFLDGVDEKLRLIAQNPLHYQVRYKSIRLALIDHFPYAIHFLIEDENVIVLAVLGTGEDPNKWFK